MSKKQRLPVLLKHYSNLISSGKLTTLAPLVSIFNDGKKPLGMTKYYQMYPMFDLKLPKHSSFMCARQVSKTFALTMRNILLSGLLPGYKNLTVEPRKDQLQKYNATVATPLLDSCLFSSTFIARDRVGNLGSKVFRNGSIMYLDYCYVSPSRLRGTSGVDQVNIDESDDIEHEFLPVIYETSTASESYGFYIDTGTPKRTDGNQAMLWEDSSQAHWAIKCPGCNKTNVPTKDFIQRMIGKKGCICGYCGKYLRVRTGNYIHAYPEKYDYHRGYQLSQVIHEFHAENPKKWRDLLVKLDKYDEVKLYNEVFGYPFSISVNLLTFEDIKNAKNDLPADDFEKARRHAHEYVMTVMGVDWSGGGELTESFTTMAVLGIKPSKKIDVLYCHRFKASVGPEQEARQIVNVFNAFNCSFLAHDYGNAGFMREVYVINLGLSPVKIAPIMYVSAIRSNIMEPHYEGNRAYYSLDKARSLVVVISFIKQRAVTLPDVKNNRDHVICDLLALTEDPRESIKGSITYCIGRKASKPDDMAHSINFAASVLWYANGGYPESDVAKRFMPRDKEFEDTRNVDNVITGK